MKTNTIKMTEEEAVMFSFALDKAQQLMVEKIGKMTRQRKIDNPIAHQNSVKFFGDKLTNLIDLNDRIQRAAKIRGY